MMLYHLQILFLLDGSMLKSVKSWKVVGMWFNIESKKDWSGAYLLF